MRYSDLDRLISGKNFVIAVDFDDTLVETTEYPYFGQTTEMFHKLLRIQRDFPNTQFILYTCREGDELDMAVKFLETNGFRIDAVNTDVESTLEWKRPSRKPFAHIYIDDRAYEASRNFVTEVFDELLESEKPREYAEKIQTEYL